MTNETKTVEQLQAEARAAQEALAEAQRREREAQHAREAAERRVAYEAEEQRKRERNATILKNILAHVRVHGDGQEWRHAQLDDRGSILGTSVRIEPQMSRASAWRSHPTGKLVVVLGDYGSDSKRYPQKADGSFSYAKIAQEIVERHQGMIARRNREQAQASAEQKASERAEAVRAAVNATTQNKIVGVVESSYRNHNGVYTTHKRVAEQGKVILRLGDMELPIEKAQEVYAALMQLGVVK